MLKQKGAATLIITVILLTAALLLLVFSAQYSMMQQKIISNHTRASEAFEAAEAGLEFGISYLTTNKTTITATASGGLINYGSTDSNITDVTLSNNSNFSVVYTNPTANNYNLVLITSTGRSGDGTATRIVQELAYASGGSTLPATITTQRSLVASGSNTITGAPYGVVTGGNITTSGSNIISGTQQNNTAIASMTSEQFFQSIFSTSQSSMQTKSAYYGSSSSVPWSNLAGTVWINSGVTLSGNTTIGTTANPVLLIVNGSFVSSGRITVNGLVYVMGAATISGNVSINGGLIAQGQITMSGTGALNNTAIIGKLLASGPYSFVPGSWKDF